MKAAAPAARATQVYRLTAVLIDRMPTIVGRRCPGGVLKLSRACHETRKRASSAQRLRADVATTPLSMLPMPSLGVAPSTRSWLTPIGNQ